MTALQLPDLIKKDKKAETHPLILNEANAQFLGDLQTDGKEWLSTCPWWQLDLSFLPTFWICILKRQRGLNLQDICSLTLYVFYEGCIVKTISTLGIISGRASHCLYFSWPLWGQARFWRPLHCTFSLRGLPLGPTLLKWGHLNYKRERKPNNRTFFKLLHYNHRLRCTTCIASYA